MLHNIPVKMRIHASCFSEVNPDSDDCYIFSLAKNAWGFRGGQTHLHILFWKTERKGKNWQELQTTILNVFADQ